MNPYKLLKDLLPDPPLLIGEVMDFANGTAIVELPDGSTVQARGDTTVGAKVFVKDGAIEGVAPSLTVEIIEV